MNAVLYAFPVFLLLIVAEVAYAHFSGKKVFRFHDSLTSMNVGIISEIVRGLIKTITFGFYALLELKVGLIAFEASDPLAWVLAFFLYDFFYYWAHRSGHEINILWSAHSTHHSSEEFNMATAMRQSATTVFYVWIFYLPMAILGIPVPVFIVISFASLFYQFWVHTRLIPKLGWYDRVFVSPSNHRVHHGQNGYCIDANYGATLILWDRLFGTYAEESDEEPVVYGIRKPVKTWSPVWANLVVLVRIVRAAVTMPGWKNRLMVLFGPPGWDTQSNAIQKTDFEPETFRRFDTAVYPWQRRYLMFSFVLIVTTFLHFLTVAYDLPMATRLAYGGLLVLHAGCIGWVSAGNPFGLIIDGVRAVGSAALVLAGVWFTIVTKEAQIAAGVVLVILLMLYALMWQEQRRTNGAMQTQS